MVNDVTPSEYHHKVTNLDWNKVLNFVAYRGTNVRVTNQELFHYDVVELMTLDEISVEEMTDEKWLFIKWLMANDCWQNK